MEHTYLNKIRRFADFRCQKPEVEENEILIYGPIVDLAFFEDEVTTKAIMDRLEELKESDEITVRLNSPGGFAFEGITIYNALVRHSAKIIVAIDGLAASAASIVAMAGDRIKIADNGAMMIHDPWGFAIGTAEDMTAQAEALDTIAKGLANTYAARTGQSKADIRKWMKKETWFTADEAKKNGFADEVIKLKQKAMTSIELSIFNNVPDWAREAFSKKEEETPSEGAEARNQLMSMKRRLQILELENQM
jgi:ATP-dependent Clp protease, protease subunit